jgi:hypothetical protein
MRLLGKQASLVQLRVGAPFLVAVRKDRSRASAQAGFISPLCPGQHWRLRPFRLLAAAAGFLCKKVAPGQHRREAPFFAPVAQLSERSPPKAVVVGETPAGSTSFGRVVQRELEDPTDRESVSLGGASPLSPTIF